jgi:hypothetical protein
MKKTVLILISTILILQGCMTVNRQMLGKADIYPPAQKATAIVEVKTGELIQTLNGDKVDKDAMPGNVVLNALTNSIMMRWKRNNIIAGYNYTGSLETLPDYTVIVSGTSNKDSSTMRNILCGLTLMLIPTSTTMTYDLNIELINNHSQKHYQVKARNAVTKYTHLFLLPTLPFASSGGQEMLQDIADYTYDELRKQGAFNLYL